MASGAGRRGPSQRPGRSSSGPARPSLSARDHYPASYDRAEYDPPSTTSPRRSSPLARAHDAPFRHSLCAFARRRVWVWALSCSCCVRAVVEITLRGLGSLSLRPLPSAYRIRLREDGARARAGWGCRVWVGVTVARLGFEVRGLRRGVCGLVCGSGQSRRAVGASRPNATRSGGCSSPSATCCGAGCAARVRPGRMVRVLCVEPVGDAGRAAVSLAAPLV